MSVTDVNNLKFWATHSGCTINMATPNPITMVAPVVAKPQKRLFNFYISLAFLIVFRNMLPMCCCSYVCSSFTRKHQISSQNLSKLHSVKSLFTACNYPHFYTQSYSSIGARACRGQPQDPHYIRHSTNMSTQHRCGIACNKNRLVSDYVIMYLVCLIHLLPQLASPPADTWCEQNIALYSSDCKTRSLEFFSIMSPLCSQVSSAWPKKCICFLCDPPEHCCEHRLRRESGEWRKQRWR